MEGRTSGSPSPFRQTFFTFLQLRPPVYPSSARRAEQYSSVSVKPERTAWAEPRFLRDLVHFPVKLNLEL